MQLPNVRSSGMLGVVRSLKDTIIRFALNQQDLDADAVISTRTLTVAQTRKFFEGETIVVRNDTQGEIRVIDRIIDEKTMTTTEDLMRTWTVAEGAMVQKAPAGQFVKRVYLGDPDVIPDYPAITVMGDDRNEEWWTIGSTMPNWSCTVTVLLDDASTEAGYEGLLSLTNSVEQALWSNRWPVFDVNFETDLILDVNAGERIIQVDDSSGFKPEDVIHIEDLDHTEYNVVRKVIDINTIELKNQLCFDYSVSEGATIIFPSRWVVSSKTGNTQYGFVHKGTLLKAAKISWTAEEEMVRNPKFTGPVKL